MSVWKKVKKDALHQQQCNIQFISFHNEKIIIINKDIMEVPFSRNNIIKYMSHSDVIISQPNTFSLMVKFILKEIKCVLFSKEGKQKKIFKEGHLLFSNTQEAIFEDFYDDNFILFHEVWLYLFNEYKKVKFEVSNSRKIKRKISKLFNKF